MGKERMNKRIPARVGVRRMAGILLAMLLVGALALPTAAMAADAAIEGYGGVGGRTQSDLGVRGEEAESNAGNLPFTGLDVALLAGAGLVLAGLGVTLRLVTARRSPQTPQS